MTESTPKIWHHHPLVQAVRAACDCAELDSTDLKDAERILTACCMVLEPENTRPSEIKAILTEVNNGYGGWLGLIADAILAAEMDDRQRAALYGAFGMASAFLFDISLQQLNSSPQSGKAS
jgi:hypothetical protein